MNKENLPGSNEQVGQAGQTHPTIALLCDRLVNAYSCNMWRGVTDASWELGANLVYFASGILDHPYDHMAQANVLYRLVNSGMLDGLVIWGSQLGRYSGTEKIQVLCEGYRPLPVVNIGMALEGIPSLVVDSYPGMHEAVAHLIKTHGYRRIAFIRGPEGNLSAQERYRAYIDALAECDIPFDPRLVVSEYDITGFLQHNPEVGNEAAGIHVLLDDRGLHPQVDFDAVVGNGDGITLAVLGVLRERGIQVPDEVALSSFDDLEESRYTFPPLTTVRVAARDVVHQPIYNMGWQAVELLLALIRGEEMPDVVTLSSELVVRQSCGCADPLVTQAAAGPVERTGGGLGVAWAAHRGEILAEMVQEAGSLATHVDPDWPDRLLDAFVAALTAGSSESPGLFLRELDDVLRQTVSAGDGSASGSEQGPEAWHDIISVLYRHAWPYLDGEALVRGEDLGQQARMIIAEAARRAQAYRALQTERRDQVLYDVGEALITTFDVGELMDVLAAQLPQLGIPSCYLSLYEDPRPYEYPQPAPEWSWLVLAYSAVDTSALGPSAGGRRPEGRLDLSSQGRRFRSRELIPEGMWPHGRRYSFLVEPLHFREHQLGFALFEVGPREGTVYSALRAQISSALRGALLLEGRKQAGAALEKAYAVVEQQVHERTAELERESAERERVQEENLRLQQEVIEAQRQALHELSTPIIPVMDLPRGGSVIVVPLIGNIDNMRARDITRRLLVGIREHRAKVIILDVTGVQVVDTSVANHLNKAIQAARLKGARTIVTGISDAVAETIVDLGIDWSGITMLGDLESGLQYVWQKSSAA
jgi:DNA-binding LacI/PurR family transcriptional regulator/anti-anti-sigma regulatory factor